MGDLLFTRNTAIFCKGKEETMSEDLVARIRESLMQEDWIAIWGVLESLHKSENASEDDEERGEWRDQLEQLQSYVRGHAPSWPGTQTP